jgi:hypothetical protein
VYQLQLVVVQKPTKVVAHGKVEATLKVQREDDLLLHVLGQELLPHHRLSLHLCFWPQQPAVHQGLDLGLMIVDRTHTVRGSGMGAPPLLGLDLDLNKHRVLMRMRGGARRRAAVLVHGRLEQVMEWTHAPGKRLQGCGSYGDNDKRRKKRMSVVNLDLSRSIYGGPPDPPVQAPSVVRCAPQRLYPD